jgi:hypothetical protein
LTADGIADLLVLRAVMWLAQGDLIAVLLRQCLDGDPMATEYVLGVVERHEALFAPLVEQLAAGRGREVARVMSVLVSGLIVGTALEHGQRLPTVVVQPEFAARLRRMVVRVLDHQLEAVA